jgi:hypothetical protein
VTLISTMLDRIYRDRHTTSDATVYACHRPTGRATSLGLALPQGLYQYGGLRATAVRGSTAQNVASLARAIFQGSVETHFEASKQCQ